MKLAIVADWCKVMSRAPRGARGLKLPFLRKKLGSIGRAPRGARGLKRSKGKDVTVVPGRAPRGARGLKLAGKQQNP